MTYGPGLAAGPGVLTPAAQQERTMARKLKAVNEVPAGSVDVPEGGGDVDFGVTADAVDMPDEVPAEKPKKRGRKAQVVAEETFMDEAADADRASAKAKHVDDGLKGVSEMVARMVKGVAYARTVQDLEVKLAVLTEVADTAAAITADARRAVRNAAAENRNLQPSP